MKSIIFAVLAVLLLVPWASGQEGDGEAQSEEDIVAEILERDGEYITFYGHVFGTGRGTPMPMNTQYPLGEDDYSRGIFGNCGPGWTTSSGSSCETWTENEEFFYTTAGFVQVKNVDDWGGDYTKFHNERGQTKDLYLDTSLPIKSSLYMSADWHAWLVAFGEMGLAWNWDPGYYKDWVVETWVWHGPLGEHQNLELASTAPDMTAVANRDPSFIPVAHGKTDPVDMFSFGPTVPVVGNATVWEFANELTWDEGFVANGGFVPKEDDLIVEFEWYQETEGQKYILATYLVGTSWNLNGGEDFPNRVEVPVRNPLDVELVSPLFVHEKLVVIGVVNTPWGSYDIDLEDVTLEIKDEDGNIVPINPEDLERYDEVSVAHTGHFDPLTVTWVWDYLGLNLASGEYTATVRANNFQDSYQTETVATFTIEDGEGASTTSARSGIGTFSDDLLSAAEDEGQERADADETNALLTGGDGDEDEGEDSPGLAGLVTLALLVGLAVALRRRP